MVDSLWHHTARSHDLCTGTGDCLSGFDLVKVLLAKTQLEGGVEATNQWQNGVDVYWFRAEEGWWLELICKSLAIAC